KKINQQSLDLTATTDQHHFSYMWHWLGVPIIQMPTDIIVLQEIIWKEKPQVIIETGIARGGSVIFFSSMLQLLGEGQVIAIDIDIRPHNYASIVTHPCSHRIKMIEGSSIDQKVVAQVKNSIPSNARTMVILDSNHTHEH